MNLWIHAAMCNFPRLRGFKPKDHFEKALGVESEEVMVSRLSTTIIKVHLQCPSTPNPNCYYTGQLKGANVHSRA